MEDSDVQSDVRTLRASLRAMKKERKELEDEQERRERKLLDEQERRERKQERRERKLLDALSSAGIGEFEIGQMHTYTYRVSRHIAWSDTPPSTESCNTSD